MTSSADMTRRVFLDIDSLSQWDVDLVQRFPKGEKVVITGLEPGPAYSWDARCVNYAAPMYDGGRFRMWYTSQPEAESHSEGADHLLTAYAESDDGIHWVKPNLKITGQKRYPGNNLLTIPGACMGVVRALPGSPFKYLMAAVKGGPVDPDISDIPGNPDDVGTFLYTSNDGLQWKYLAKAVQHGDNADLFADPEAGRYLLYQKAGLIHGLKTRRSWLGLESRDGIHWEGHDGLPYGAHKWRECFVADDYDDLIAKQRGAEATDFYTIAAHRVGELYIALQTAFTQTLPMRTLFAQTPNGYCHFRLLFSHNAFNWRYPAGRPSWLELGEMGEWDGGYMVTAMNFLEHNDEALMYYSACPHRHGWFINTDFSLREDLTLAEQRNTYRIGLAKIKRDRYACLATSFKSRFDIEPDAHGSKPLYVNPAWPQLYVNVRSTKGAVRLALGEYGTNKNLPGFDFEDCIPISADEVKAPVRFRGKSIASIPADKAFYLRFELHKAEIYAYEWGA